MSNETKEPEEKPKERETKIEKDEENILNEDKPLEGIEVKKDGEENTITKVEETIEVKIETKEIIQTPEAKEEEKEDKKDKRQKG